MTAKTPKRFIDTNARILLSDCKTLTELVVKHSTPVKEAIQQPMEEAFQSEVLSDQQIQEILSGPYQTFFKQKMTAYAAIIRLQTELTITKEDVFKGKRSPHSKQTRLPKKLVEKFSLADVENIRKKLDQLTIEHDQQWEQQLSQWCNTIAEQLNTIGISLTDIEIQELHDPEPLSELLNRFTHLNIDLPKLKKSKMNFTNYLTLKTHLAIHSSLSRQHQSHQAADIKNNLKQLKSIFDSINKEEKQIIAEQKSATDEVIKPIAFALSKTKK